MNDTVTLDRSLVEAMLASLPVRRNFGVAFVAKRAGVAAQYLYSHPEMQPNFGVSDVPGKKLWSIETIQAWESRPMREHADDWQKLPAATKRSVALKRGRS